MRLALFFTYGMSLEKWDKNGSLNREIKPYQILAEKFGQVYFFTYGFKKDLEFQEKLGNGIIILPNKWKIPNTIYGFLMPFFYWKILKDIDFLKTNQMAGSIPAVIAKIIFKKKLVARNGYEWLNVLIKEKKIFWKKAIVYFWEKIVYKVADVIIFTSNKDKNFAQKKFNIQQEKIKVIPNYIDTEVFKPQNIVFKKNSVVYVGRLSKEKNLLSLLQGVSLLPVPVKIVFIGQGSLQNKLKEFAQNNKVEVEFKGKINNNDLPKELSQAEIFVLPSLYEGSPKALLEAMACECLCLGTDVEGINEVIQNGKNGYLCQTDADSIKKGIWEIMSLPETEKEKIKKQSRKTILNNFSLEKILNKEVEIYIK